MDVTGQTVSATAVQRLVPVFWLGAAHASSMLRTSSVTSTLPPKAFLTLSAEAPDSPVIAGFTVLSQPVSVLVGSCRSALAALFARATASKAPVAAIASLLVAARLASSPRKAVKSSLKRRASSSKTVPLTSSPSSGCHTSLWLGRLPFFFGSYLQDSPTLVSRFLTTPLFCLWGLFAYFARSLFVTFLCYMYICKMVYN